MQGAGVPVYLPEDDSGLVRAGAVSLPNGFTVEGLGCRLRVLP